MSAGAFTITKYLADYAGGTNIHPIRVQPETIAADADGTANDAPTADATSPISAQVSRSRKGLGLHARLVALEIVGTPPTGYKVGSRTKIPALTPAFYSAAIAPGAVITYLGTTWRKAGSSVEVVK